MGTLSLRGRSFTCGVAVTVLVAVMLLAVVWAPAARASGSSGSSRAWPIGVICSCTGPEASSTSVSTPTLMAWAKYVDSKGGINGHKISLFADDDATNPGTALTDAEKLVSQDHVLAIFDNSDVDSAFATYVAQKHVPVVGSYADSDEMYTNADFFPNGATINWEPTDGVYVAKKVHAKKLADLYCAEVAICKQATDAGEATDAKAGLKVVYSAAISFAAPNYTAECLAAKSAGAQAMTVGDASAIVVKVAQDCQQQGYKPVQLSADGTVAESWRTTSALNGNIDVQPDIPFFVRSTAATKAMYSAIDKFEPSLARSQDFGEVVVEAWTSGLLFQAAAQAAHLGNGAKPSQVIHGLYDLHAATLG
ncbi:MAG: ABC transporter substrate-binding protein, partial [Nitrososphaerales archaeon]